MSATATIAAPPSVLQTITSRTISRSVISLPSSTTTTRAAPKNWQLGGNPPLGRGQSPWRTWRRSRTQLGRLVAFLFSLEVGLAFLLGAVLSGVRDARQWRCSSNFPSSRYRGYQHRSPPSPWGRLQNGAGAGAFLPVLLWQLLIACAVRAASASPAPGTSLPPAIYGPAQLHREQRRRCAGPGRRRIILGAKIGVAALEAALLRTCAALAGRTTTDLAVLAYRGGWGGVLDAALAVLDVLAALWGCAAAGTVAGATLVAVLACFAWSPLPDGFSVAELRALVKAEEAARRRRRRWRGIGGRDRGGGGGGGNVEGDGKCVGWEEDDDEDGFVDENEEAIDTEPPRLIWTVQEGLARLGEAMVAFVERHD